MLKASTLNSLKKKIESEHTHTEKVLAKATSNLAAAKEAHDRAIKAHQVSKANLEKVQSLQPVEDTPVAKRGPGRPKKIEAGAVKRGPGRPKKETQEAAPKRGPGRPKKVVEVAVEVTPKRKPGRPKKVETQEAAPKRGPGRPKKVETQEAAPKRGPGRPKKIDAAGSEAPKRKPGRPKKNESIETTPKAKAGLSMLEAMQKVMGSDAMNASDIAAALRKLPKEEQPKSNKLEAYVAQVLSTESKKDSPAIEKVSRGQYRFVNGSGNGVNSGSVNSGSVNSGSVNSVASETKEKDYQTVKVENFPQSADEVLADLGFTPPQQDAQLA